jgi:hypothetical protein
MLQCALNYSVWFVLTLKRLKVGKDRVVESVRNWFEIGHAKVSEHAGGLNNRERTVQGLKSFQSKLSELFQEPFVKYCCVVHK